VYPKVSGLSR